MKHRAIHLNFRPLAAALVVFGGVTIGFADEATERGKAAFAVHCARCHGADAKGGGVDAKHVTVAPRDLTSGKFKFKSTVWGTPPSDEDVVNGILGHGLPGSGMPGFGNLPKPTREDLVAYIKTISPAFQSGQSPQPLPRPKNERAKADLSQGKEIYNKLQCGLCHGPSGRANGSSAFTLVDAWNKPIRVANLTQGWTYRGGSKTNDIYNRIVAGIEGAPMPSYEGAATHEEMWTLSAYVASMQLKADWSYDVFATKLTGDVPTAGDDAQWRKAPRTDVNLQDYFYENDQRQHLMINAVSVQALTNESTVALRVAWDDPTQNAKTPSDALAVVFKPATYAGDTRGTLHNLYEPNDPALDLTLWQASSENGAGWSEANLASLRTGAPSKKLNASAVYDDGRWTLVIVRPLDTNPNDKWKADGAHPLGFIAWDGGNGETGLKRSASEWILLHLGRKAAH